MEKNILQTLQVKSTEVQNDENQINSLYKEYHEKNELLKLKQNNWLSLKEEIIKKLKEGSFTK